MSEASERIRIDRWLWFARFFKSRTTAAEAVSKGHVRLNGAVVTKPKTEVKAGDEVTFLQNDRQRIVLVLAPGVRRGPATEAQTLYEDRTPEIALPSAEEMMTRPPQRDRGAGRPTKRERRATDRLKGEDF